MIFKNRQIENNDIISRKLVQAFSDVANAYGMTMEESTQVLDTLANYLQIQGYGLPSDYEEVLSQLRSVSDVPTENPNQKTDLEIFELNTQPHKEVIISAENSKWDTELLDKNFPNWKDPNTFSTEPYLKEEFQIKYDDDWIKEILEEV